MVGQGDGVPQDGIAEGLLSGGDAAGTGPIKVDFTRRAGLRQVSLSPGDALRRSGEAIEAAMDTIHAMADRVCHAVDAMARHPDEVEVEFGITLDAEAGALIARTSVEAALTVKVKWTSGARPAQEGTTAPGSAETLGAPS